MLGNDKLCRLCLIEVTNVVPIFSTKNVAETSSLQMKIMELANVQVYAGDGLPSHVCFNCSKLLDSYHAFKIQIEKSDVILRHQLSSNQTDPLSDENKQDIGTGTAAPTAAEGAVVKAEALYIKDEQIDEDHVESVIQPSDGLNSRSPSPALPSPEPPDDDDVDMGGDDDDDDDEDDVMDNDEDCDPLAGDNSDQSNLTSTVEPIKVSEKLKPIAPALPKVDTTVPNATAAPLLLLITKPQNSTITSGITAPTFVTVPAGTNFVAIPSATTTATVTSTSSTISSTVVSNIKKDPLIDAQPGPSTSNASLGETSTSGEQEVDWKRNSTSENQENSNDEGNTKPLNINEAKKDGSKRVCEICDYVCETFALYRKHKAEEHKNVKPTCDICNKSFSSKNMARHKKFSHSKNLQYYPCKICNKLFKYPDYVNAHVKLMHTGSKEYNCNMCDKKFKRKYDIKLHKSTVHVNKELKCLFCDKLLKNETSLKYHVKYKHSDSSKKLFVCEICGKHVTYLNSHMKSHLEKEKSDVICDVCGKTYPNSHRLLIHKKYTHNTERKHTCEICGASFKMSQELKKHLLVHNDERNYKCDICNSTFKFPHVLKTHFRIHSGVEPYKCTNCSESFRWKGSYDKHLMNCSKELIPGSSF